MFEELNRREWLKRTAAGVAGLAGLAGLARLAGAEEAASPEAKPKSAPIFSLYVMDTGLAGRDVPTLEAKVELAGKLGFAGIDFGINHRQLPRMLELLDKNGLELSAVYVSPLLEDSFDRGLEGSIKLMKGRKTRVELAIRSKKFKPSDPQGDKPGTEYIQRVSDLCGDSGPVVSIYPHTWSWTERVEDGVRLAKAVNRDNVGTNFNLVHWKWVKNTRPLEELLKEALAYLKTVTINGLEEKPNERDRIVPLDQGNYDVEGFLALLKKVGYRGGVGLQGYGVPGSSAEHLKRSMDKWKAIMKKLEA